MLSVSFPFFMQMGSGGESLLDVTFQRLPVPEESLVTIVPICSLFFFFSFFNTLSICLVIHFSNLNVFLTFNLGKKAVFAVLLSEMLKSPVGKTRPSQVICDVNPT